MGKQRTPQGRSIGRRPPAKPPTPLKAVALAAALHPAEDAFPAVPSEAAPEPLHAHLLDTVSPEALSAATPAAEPQAAPAEMPVPADANLAEPEFAESDIAESDIAETDIAEPDLVAAPSAEPETSSARSEAPVAEPEVATAAPEPSPPVEAAPVAAAEPEAAPAYTNVVPLKSVAPSRPPEPAAPVEAGEAPVRLSDGALPSPASWRAGRRPVPALRQDLEGLGETLFTFMRDESSAVLTHLNALKDARSPADAIRLQVNEMQRVADASLTCWSELARRATRIVAQR